LPTAYVHLNPTGNRAR